MSLILKTDCGDRVELVEVDGRLTIADALHMVAENYPPDDYGACVEEIMAAVRNGERVGEFKGEMGWQVIQGVETREVNGRWVCFAGLSPEASRVTGWGSTEVEAGQNYAKGQPKPDAEGLREEFLKIIQADDDENAVLLLAWENLMGTECEFAPIPELLDLFNAVRA